MDTLEMILADHAGRYPLMEPVDAVKLLYQHVFGGGHLVRDPDACLHYLLREYEATPQDPAGMLLEDIGGGMVRVMLSALDAAHYPPEALARDFIRGCAMRRGSLEEFLEKLEILRKVTGEGRFTFTPEDLEVYLAQYRRAGYPMVSHSPRYREAYHPAYRILPRELLPETL